MPDITLLPDRAVLSVSGDDTITFLQGLVTNHMRHVEEGRAMYSALLTPQGKFLHDFFMIPREGGVWIETRRDRLPDLLKRLTMYRLRAKVVFEDLSEKLAVAGTWNDTAPGIRADVHFIDPRNAALGERWIGARDAFAAIPVNPDAYERHRLQLGVPEGGKDLEPDKSLLLEYDFEALNGVDFAKGCYVGQEVTARTKHRANMRKMIFKVTADRGLPDKGTKIMAGEREIGEMRSSLETIGLALLNQEEVEKAPRLTADGIMLKAVPLR